MRKTTKLEKSISAVGIIVLYTNHPNKYVWSLILTSLGWRGWVRGGGGVGAGGREAERGHSTDVRAE